MRLLNRASYRSPLPMPLKTYKATFVWSRDICYDTVGKQGRRYVLLEDDVVDVQSLDYPTHLPSVDYEEDVHYTLFSVSPLIWSENDWLFLSTEEASTPSEKPRQTKPRPARQPKPRQSPSGEHRPQTEEQLDALVLKFPQWKSPS